MENTWEELENSCFDYLKKLYPNRPLIEAYGKSDSTKADILVEFSTNDEFYIEVKADTSQCCQFVLFPNTTTQQFDFSSENKVPCSDNCKKIIEYMNSLYKKYYRVSKNGISIEVEKSTLYGLVQDFYSLKNVKYFMTKADDFIVIPAANFSKYFNIECFYRKKSSGSTEPNKNNNENEIIRGLKKNKIDGTLEYIFIGNKNRCFLHTTQNIDKYRMICSDYTYQFKNNNYSRIINRKSSYVYEIRRLSNTCNPTVICQLSLNKQKSQDKFDFEIFKQNMAINRSDFK